MLMVAENREIVTGGISEVGAFKIAANAKAFRVLIDGLYSDKPRAIIRELWSNALDSHVMAGIGDRPFVCTLPTYLNPEFKVRDFGVSLTHDQVMNLYTTVFASTKDGLNGNDAAAANTQVGKFGLGSKTPFAYTEQFSVVAYLNGEKRAYSAFINEGGVPMIALFSTEKTQEENGLEVSFSVKQSDIYSFSTAAQTVAFGFDVKPIVNTELKQLDKKLSGKGWTVVDGLPNSHTAYARQGCVMYPIDENAIPGLTSSHTSLLNSSIVIEFAIGEVDVTPSRETLSYDARTISNIKKRVVEIEAELFAVFAETLNKATTKYEARLCLSSLSSGFLLPQDVVAQFKRTATWRGKSIAQVFRVSMRQGITCTYTSFCEGVKRKAYKFDYKSRTEIQASKNLIILVQDTNKKITYPGVRVKELVSRVTNSANHLRPDVLWIRGDVNSVGFKRLIASIGRPPMFDLTSVPLPASLTRTVKLERSAPRLRYLDQAERKAMPDEEMALEQVEYYIPGKNGVPTDMSVSSAISLIHILHQASLLRDDAKVFVLSPRQIEKCSGENILEIAQNEIDLGFDLDLMAEYEVVKEEIDYSSVFSLVRTLCRYNLRSYLEASGSASANILKVLDYRKELGEKVAPLRSRYLIANALGKVTLPQVKFDVSGVKAEFKKTYPLVSRLNRTTEDKEFCRDLANYIKLVNGA